MSIGLWDLRRAQRGPQRVARSATVSELENPKTCATAEPVLSMCGRFSLTTPVPDLATIFDADAGDLDPRPPRYNVSPTESVIVLRRGASGRELVSLRWGLVPHWAQDPDDLPLMINARSETLTERRAFRDLLGGRRCAVLADGFYEWRTEAGVKQPYWVRRRDQTPLPLAGLWDVWRRGADAIRSCTIITTAANEILAPLHERMPAILDAEGARLWLDATPDHPPLETLFPSPSADLEVFPVSTRVNRTSVDDPGCLEPLDRPLRSVEGWRDRPPTGGSPEMQLGLFPS